MANMYNTPITIIKVITLQEPTPRTKLQTFFCSSKSSPSCHGFFVSAKKNKKIKKKKTSDKIEGNFVPGPKDSKMRADVVCYNCLLSTFAKTPTGSPRVCQVIFWMIYLGINVSWRVIHLIYIYTWTWDGMKYVEHCWWRRNIASWQCIYTVSTSILMYNMLCTIIHIIFVWTWIMVMSRGFHLKM